MIHYHKDNYNCAHHAISRVNEFNESDIRFSNGDEWQSEFIPMLRHLFKPVNRPINGCLVVMSQMLGGLHLGFFINGHVEHNYKPINSAGCVIKSDLGTIRSEYLRVRFYAYSKDIPQRG